MDVVDFVKRNAPSFMASMVISFPACLWFVNQFVYTPKVEALEIINKDLHTRNNELKDEKDASKKESQDLGDKKDSLTTNLHKSNSELTVNNYNLQNLTNKINDLNNDKNILNLKLDQAYADNRKLLAHLKNYQENADILQKISNLELKKQNARNGHGRSVFDNKTDQEIRADNEVIAKEYQQQILNLQDKLKCVNQS